MKIRTDFVTNSSSSSYVIGFKKEDDIYNVIDNDDFFAKKNCKKIIDKITKSRITKSQLLYDFVFEEYYSAKDYVEEKYRREMGWRKFHDWIMVFDNKEKFYQEVNDILKKWTEEFKLDIDEYDYISVIYYDDHSNPEIEKYIISNLGERIEIFDHH